jgi:hypothetical protein
VNEALKRVIRVNPLGEEEEEGLDNIIKERSIIFFFFCLGISSFM